MIFTAAIEKFKKELLQLERSNETIKCYTKDLKYFNKYLVEKQGTLTINLHSITTEHVQDFLYYLLSEKYYAPNSRRRALNTIKSFYNFCFRTKLCNYNITNELEHIKIWQRERVFLSESEVALLLDNIKNPVIKVLATTLYYTGLRISECTQIELHHVDFQNDVLFIRHGKGKKSRNIPISKKLKTLLINYTQNLRIVTNSNKFFCTKTGGVSSSYVNRVLNTSAREAGISKHVTAHILRHSFASNLLKHGVDIVKIQRLLGHAHLSTTCIYIHTNIEDLRNSVNVL